MSNLPLWRGEADAEPIREATVHHSINGSFSIRRGRWKLELCPGSGGWSWPKPGEETDDMPAFQLYDLEADIGERTNVIAEHPDVEAELKALLVRYVKQGRSTPGSPQENEGGVLWEGLEWMESEG